MEDKGDVSRVENLLRLNISHIKVEHLTFILGSLGSLLVFRLLGGPYGEL